jgi:MFS family permease
VGSAAPGRKRGWRPLAVIASAHLMAVLDTIVVFVALPSAQHALGLTVTVRQWVVTAYTLALAGLLLPAGRLADRRTLLIGLVARPARECPPCRTCSSSAEKQLPVPLGRPTMEI